MYSKRKINKTKYISLMSLMHFLYNNKVQLNHNNHIIGICANLVYFLFY